MSDDVDNRDDLIKDVIDFAKENFKGDLLRKIGSSKTQFQDNIRAAEQATSVDEFKLYIAYKAAKARDSDLWNSLGGKLNKFITDTFRENEVEKLRLAMGYMMWAAYAASAGELKNV